MANPAYQETLTSVRKHLAMAALTPRANFGLRGIQNTRLEKFGCVIANANAGTPLYEHFVVDRYLDRRVFKLTSFEMPSYTAFIHSLYS